MAVLDLHGFVVVYLSRLYLFDFGELLMNMHTMSRHLILQGQTFSVSYISKFARISCITEDTKTTRNYKTSQKGVLCTDQL